MDGVIGEGGCDAMILKQEAPHCPLVFGQIQIDLSANVLLSHVCLTFVTVCILFQFSHFSSILIFLYCVVFSYSLFGLIFHFSNLVFCVLCGAQNNVSLVLSPRAVSQATDLWTKP